MPLYITFRKNLYKFGFESYYLVGTTLVLVFIWLPSHPTQMELVSGFFFALMPFVLPVLLFQVLWETWLEYIRGRQERNTEYCLLEVRLPEDITQTPFAAELMLRGIYQTGEIDGIFDEYLKGKSRPWFSLEIVSTEGVVKFYIWTRRRYKNLVESQVYAHYPNVQVIEVPDYTLKVPYDPAVVDIWGVEQALQKPDPYPIATYVELKMDKAEVEEEYKSDPLNSLIEFLGSIGEGEHIWIQYVIRAHTAKFVCPWAEEQSGISPLPFDQWVEYEKQQILAKTVIDEKDKPNFSKLSEGDKDLINAMERKMNKQLFEVGIRGVYLARNEKARSEPKTGIPSAFRSFEHGSEGRGLNGVKPIFWIGPFNYPWEDFMGLRRAMLKRWMYRGYVKRQYFFAPFKHRHIVLNSEELATMYHLPGKVARTPTLERMLSRRSEAPANLPT